jgi:predicted amidohydrolase YtcJ
MTNLAILSSRIFTGNTRMPWAQALFIKDGRIADVGSDEKIKNACRNAETETLKMPGRLITPGFVDAHCHFGLYGRSLLVVDLVGQPSITACRGRIKSAVEKRTPGEWIIGLGWNHHQWKDHREPTISDIDDLTPDNPAMMIRACGHTAWVNSFALQAAGITAATKGPDGGRIERDPTTGKPNGLIREALHLVQKVIPPMTRQEWENTILAAQDESLKVGLTGIHSFEGLEQWEAMASLETKNKLKLRVHHSIGHHEVGKAVSQGLTPGTGSDRLWIGHAKLFADGTLGSGTALLHEPYTDEPENSGLAVCSVEDLRKKIETAYEYGYDVAIHSIGDQATTNCLEAIANARKKHPGNRRDRIEHIQLLRHQDIRLFMDLGITASVQPIFLPTDWATADKRWGHARCSRGGYAWKTILKANIPTQFGSDCPIEPNNPLLGLHAAVTRQTLAGEPEGGWFPEERLSLEEGITGFTKTAAWSSHKEHLLGSITPGNLADLTIFQSDLFQLPVNSLPSVNVEMTIINGEIVYQAE